ncbi:unnamed protein product [Ilex paraguariensis]|uniref:Uncharacterized protein n=1 Tax=Ilex paraguariensis TaxID=185542 RepID=A0ABC8V5C4_9AQUA
MATQALGKLEPWCNLDGKVVMVTGASSGLGREFCIDLAKGGCKVVAAACRIDRLKSLCDQINQFNSPSPRPTMVDSRVGNSPRAVAVELDVTADGSTIEASVQKAWDSFGHIDALVNNAGVRGLNRIQVRGGVAYSSSKAAMDSMTKTMALELGQHRIRVNSIAFGLFRSEITEDLMKKHWLSNVALRSVPLKTFGTSDPALTSLIRYLIHDSSGYVSGNLFIVDAGYTLPGFEGGGDGQVLDLETTVKDGVTSAVGGGCFSVRVGEKLDLKKMIEELNFLEVPSVFICPIFP